MKSLTTYNQKRHFNKTPEPNGAGVRSSGKSRLKFVVQKHDASHLHYDFRLELNGVLKSWAIPKGPSLNPADKRLAVQVEDHPISYGNFEGVIPKGNYGAGTVEIWDKGTYEPEINSGDPEKELDTELKKGSLKFVMHGEKLNGSFALVMLKDGKHKNWLLIKHRDKFASDTTESKSKESAKPTLKATADVKSKKEGGKAKKKPAKDEQKVRINGHIVKLTHLDKIFWPDEKITKGDIINYYNTIGKYILPYLKDRPESLKRNPNGIIDKGFFHKDAGQEAPDWVKSIPIHSASSNKDVDYIVCNNQATLTYLNNLGCIEINPWNSTTKHLDKPDYMIMDIDPSDSNTFDQVVETALAIKEVLNEAGTKSYCKTSGASGLHVYIPLHAAYTYDQISPFAELIAVFANKKLPTITTMERPLAKRRGRIYLDYLQNNRGQTLSSAYSARPVPGAGVSTPLKWSEVKKGLHPLDYTIFTISKRLEKTGDLFSGVLTGRTDIKKRIKALESHVQ